MAKTWGDIRAETLQRMFLYTINGVEQTGSDDTADYRKAMVHAANTALRELAAAAPIERRISIAVAPVANALGDGQHAFEVKLSRGQDAYYSANAPTAYYFEVDGVATVAVEEMVNGEPVEIASISNPSRGVFTAHKGIISATPGATVRLRFAGGGAYSYRNVALYTIPFAGEDDIPAFTRYNRFDLREITRPLGEGNYFMALPPLPNRVIVIDGQYRDAGNMRWEGDDTLVLDHYATGQYEILYYAYPTEITEQTSETFVPELCAEALDLVPLYMASMLYTDDNAPIASRYLEQYMAGKSILASRAQPASKEEFYSESGWW